jgi:hypothetical protein
MSPVALALVATCNRLGIQLTVRPPDGLHVDAPKGTMTPDLLGRLKDHKPEIIAVLAARQPDQPEAPRCPTTNANRSDGVEGVANAPTGKLLSPPTQTPLPVKWKLDATDRAVLLELGYLPTPDVDDLPPNWRRAYDHLVTAMVRKGIVQREHAEALALKTIHERMLSAGELLPEGW